MRSRVGRRGREDRKTSGPAPARAFAAPKRSARTKAQGDVFLAAITLASDLERELLELMREADLSTAQFNVLRVLRGAGPGGLTCGQVGERLIRRDPDVTRLHDKLERRGLVERTRDDIDRRVVRTRITARGLAVLAGLDRPVDELHERQLGHLDQAELGDARAVLERLRARAARTR